MKELDVSIGPHEGSVLVTTHYDGERIIAYCGESLLGRTMLVTGLPLKIAESIRDGDEGALEGCLRPEGEFGAHRLSEGQAYLGHIDGLDPSVTCQVLKTLIFETLPEQNT